MIAEIDAYLASVITKIRIPELPNYASFGELTNDDLMALWQPASNKTVHGNLLTLKTFFETGGSGVITPVLTGDTAIHDVTAGEAGGDDVSLPEYAGMSFFLRLEGRPLKLNTEYEILSAGGFRILLAGYQLAEGQRFDLDFYDLQVTPGSGGSGPVSSSFGRTADITVNTSLSSNDVNKVIPIRSATAIEVTLPDVALVENGIYILETTINNAAQHKIKTTGGQFIYFNNTSRTNFHIGIAEVCWLFAGTDGWYVVNDFANVYRGIGKPAPTYKVGIDELLCEGQTKNRADYPRAWEVIQTFGAALVSDVVWNTATLNTGNGQTVEFPYRGCFSTGDGALTFRLPDFRNQFVRGLKSNSGGVDGDRVVNTPGGFQKNELITHRHGLPSNMLQFGSASGGQDGPNDQAAPIPLETANYGGTETRSDNIGVYWVIKI